MSTETPGTTVDICAHFAEHNGKCLFAQRNWSEACKPERCVGCPDAMKEKASA